MQLYLLRHGIAEDGRPGKNDASRELTAEGRRKLREILRVAAHADVKPALILSSPLIRAVQTAELAAEVLHCNHEILRTKALIPNSPVEAVWDEIRAHRDQTELMLVGHEPLFGQLAAYLLGAPELRLDFKKGAIVRIDFESLGIKPRGLLRWFLTAKLSAKEAAK